MKEEISDRLQYDPSDIKQTFADINLRLHCCRYWMLREWEFNNLSSPFWRIYYNTTGSASIMYKEIITNLSAEYIIMIPPNTSFSTRLKNKPNSYLREGKVRKKIVSHAEVFENNDNQASDHLFIHFNLGIPYDWLEPGIYSFQASDKELEVIHEIKNYCIEGKNAFDFTICTIINNLIMSLLGKIPRFKWVTPGLDKRVIQAVFHIEQHLGERLTNTSFSEKANMVENSFARLFRENTGVSIQQYIKRKRIEKALILLHHSTHKIEEIAFLCGFSDRYHFSKVFKNYTDMSPVAYKKQIIF